MSLSPEQTMQSCTVKVAGTDSPTATAISTAPAVSTTLHPGQSEQTQKRVTQKEKRTSRVTQSRRAASFKCCHQISILRKERAQPDTLLAPAVLGRPASPAPQSLERCQATSGM